MDQIVVGRKIWQQKKLVQLGSQYTWLQAVETVLFEVVLFPDAGKDGNFIYCIGKGEESRRNNVVFKLREVIGVHLITGDTVIDSGGGGSSLAGKRNSLDGLLGLLDFPSNLFFFVVESVVCQRGVIESFGEEGT